MSLLSRICTINNNLISAFAVLDGWCDRDVAFLFNRNKGGRIPFEVIQEVLIVNDYLLSFLTEQGQQGTQLNHLTSQFAGKDVFNLVPQSFRMEWIARIQEPSPHTFRVLMREQLFNFLCLLDGLHNSRLDAVNVSVHVLKPDGLRMLEMLADLITGVVRDCEEHATDSDNVLIIDKDLSDAS